MKGESPKPPDHETHTQILDHDPWLALHIFEKPKVASVLLSISRFEKAPRQQFTKEVSAIGTLASCVLRLDSRDSVGENAPVGQHVRQQAWV